MQRKYLYLKLPIEAKEILEQLRQQTKFNSRKYKDIIMQLLVDQTIEPIKFPHSKNEIIHRQDFQLPLTKSQLDFLKELKQKYNYSSIAKVLQQLLLIIIDGKKLTTAEYQTDIKQHNILLNKINININQIARFCNANYDLSSQNPNINALQTNLKFLIDNLPELQKILEQLKENTTEILNDLREEKE